MRITSWFDPRENQDVLQRSAGHAIAEEFPPRYAALKESPISRCSAAIHLG